MKYKGIFKVTVLSVIGLFLIPAQASELEIPNTFEDGQVTSASEMNANFEAIKAAVNDNNSRIDAPRSQFVGFSSAQFDGKGGLFAMQQACHILVADSHMCDTSEFTGSSYNSSAINTIEENDVAWVRPKVVAYASGYVVNEDASRVDGAGDFSCEGWRVNDDRTRASIVYSNGSLGSQDCRSIAKVACCK